MIAALKAFTHENDELMLIENPSSREKILAAFVSRHLQVDKQTDDILACYTDGTLSEAEVRRTWVTIEKWQDTQLRASASWLEIEETQLQQ